MSQITLPLKKFVEHFALPQNGVKAKGFCNNESQDNYFDFPNECVLNLRRQVCNTVDLTVKDSNNNSDVTISLPVDFPGRFYICAYDPVDDDSSVSHVFPTVGDLIESFPLYAQAQSSFEVDQPDFEPCCVQQFDVLKLLRLIYKYGGRFLECRIIGRSRVVLLPMQCHGLFKALKNNNIYTLSELTTMVPRKRKLQIENASDLKEYINDSNTILNADIFMNVPDTIIEASPVDDEYMIVGIPDTLVDITIQLEDNKDHHLLQHFATNNRNIFPIVASVLDWKEETTILENHFVRPGAELIIHGWTRQSKILADIEDRKYAIPLTYQGYFKIKPSVFHGVGELEKAHPVYDLTVAAVEPNDILQVGDVIRIRHKDSLHRNGRVDYNNIRCDIISPQKKSDVKVPIDLDAQFEELSDNKTEMYRIKELEQFLVEQSIVVELVAISRDQKTADLDIPMGKPIMLIQHIVEPAIYVSMDTVDSPAFHIPLRTLIYVDMVQELEKADSPLLTKQNPRLSTLDRCVELLPGDVFNTLIDQLEDDMMSMTSFAARANNWSNNANGVVWQDITKNQGAQLGHPVNGVIINNNNTATTTGSRVVVRAPTAQRIANQQQMQQNRILQQQQLLAQQNPQVVVRNNQQLQQQQINQQQINQQQMNQQQINQQKLNQQQLNQQQLNQQQIGQQHFNLQQQQQQPQQLTQQQINQQQQQLQQQYMQQQQIKSDPRLLRERQVSHSDAGSTVSGSTQRHSNRNSQTIPVDGNLYHFSVKKLAAFFHQLDIGDECVHACIKKKIDGKKFSKMTEAEMTKIGLMCPAAVYYRNLTHKRQAKFML